MDSEVNRKAALPVDGQWIHFVETTYGAWLQGDPRGFRTRYHRQHVGGDHRNPPVADAYRQYYLNNNESLKQAPVSMPSNFRPIIADAIREMLVRQGAFVLCLAVANQHIHVLAKLPAGAQPRSSIGRAKKHAAFVLRDHGWRGKLWGKRGKEIVVRSRKHQLAAHRYILAHAAQEAWVWRWDNQRGE